MGVGARPFGPPLQPGEQVVIGRVQPMPDLLHLADRDPAHVRRRLLGQPRRHPDPQAPGQQLQQRPAAGGVQGVQPGLDQPLDLGARGRTQGVDHLRQLRLAVGAGNRGPDPPRPNQGHGLGQVAHIVIGPGEQHRVHPRLHRPPDKGRLGRVETQRPGQGGQGPAAIGIGRRAQIVAHQHQLGVAGSGEGQPVQKLGESAHAPSLTRTPRIGSRGRLGRLHPRRSARNPFPLDGGRVWVGGVGKRWADLTALGDVAPL